MISFRGYGLFVIIAIQIGCLFAASKLIPTAPSSMMQLICIAGSSVIAAVINYFVGRLLNKRNVSHTVCGMKLENAALCMGGGIVFFSILAAVLV